MLYCPKCHAPLVENAKFCHSCGAAVDVPLIVCDHCEKKNPSDARSCYGCGRPLHIVELNAAYHSKFNLSYHKGKIEVEDEIKALFFYFLERQVGLVNPKQYGLYLEFFYTKEYNATVGRRSRQLADEQIALYRLRGQQALPGMEKQLEDELLGLVMYHIVHHCEEINPVYLPKEILKYEKTHIGNIKLQEMAFDYLDFDSERIRLYTDLIAMPADKLKNTAMYFLYGAKDERVLFICDQSLLGTCKEGFAMTEFGLYWKSPLNKAQKVYFHQIAGLEYHKDWITVNKKFFNVSKGVNVKMGFLLEKLSRVYG